MQIPSSITHSLSSQKILILGLGKEGLSTYNFLRQILPIQSLALADEAPLDSFNLELQAQLAQDRNLQLYLGKTYLDNLDQFTLIFKTPGVPVSLPQIQKAVQNGAKISSNLQLFLELAQAVKQKNNSQILSLPTPIVIGVTGTKGKSTTASLIHHVLKHSNFNSALVGNIGQPALNEINQIESKDVFVIEMSSHQLAQLTISPDIAVVQNITSEHLDYYQDTTEYVKSKESITRYQKVEQYIVYNPLMENATKIANLSPGKQLKFVIEDSQNISEIDIQVYLKSHCLMFRDSKGEERVIHQDDIPLLGHHNLQNIAPSIIIGKLFGLQSTQIAEAIHSFIPLPHRLEKVGVINGVTYINDSMATMPDATISALSCFGKQEIILLAGGYERNQDFSELARKIVTSNDKAIALFPANGERLWTQVKKELQKLGAEKIIRAKVVNSMDEALKFVSQFAVAGNVILLSPGAASFGIFKNYVDRGDQFRKYVMKQN